MSRATTPAIAPFFVAGDGVTFAPPPGDTSDRLRGFELTDPDGYVLLFGRPR